jgi:DNA replication protein DnaC
MDHFLIDRMEKIKQKMQKACTICKGTGIHNNQDCECAKKFERYVTLLFCGIEQEYWDKTLDDFKGDKLAKGIIIDYIENLKNAYEYGLSLGLSGPHGVGKTLASNLILIAALDTKYKIYNITLAELLKLIKKPFTDDDTESIRLYNEKVKNVDFLVVDDLGDEYTPKDFGAFCISEMSLLFRHRRRNCFPTIITTNLTKKDLEDKYGSSLSSLMKSNFKFITLSGRDYREKQGADWDKMLKSK